MDTSTIRSLKAPLKSMAAAVLLLGALVYLLVNLLVDLSYAIIDPRVRLS